MKHSENRAVGLKWFFILLIVALVFYGVWLIFFSYVECTDWECFNERIADCGKTKFIGGSSMIFEYTIYGRSGDYCEITVELLRGELNNQDSIALEGNEMVCMTPIGVKMLPEADIDNCHGLLKEGLQDITIEKLLTYLVQNVGKINLEVLDAPTN